MSYLLDELILTLIQINWVKKHENPFFHNIKYHPNVGIKVPSKNNC